MNYHQLTQEFDQQVQTLIHKNYPHLIHQSSEEFIKNLDPLKKHLKDDAFPEIDIPHGKLPFVIVINTPHFSPNQAITLLEFKGKPGIINMNPYNPDDFQPIPAVKIPDQWAYLLLKIDRGQETLNVTPNDALVHITKQNRSPLTINEGLAILIQHPEFLQKNNCFSLLASRRQDQRVPALWISKNQPKLGWCWAGNPHTWLGSASCESRAS